MSHLNVAKETSMRPTLDKHRFGPWAVVTGSSSGIGRAIARHLGPSGINAVSAAASALPVYPK
jgi:hypothetical protein